MSNGSRADDERSRKDRQAPRKCSFTNEAIEHFGLLIEFGPEDPEVGDCFSLLGRTYLELNDLTAAESAIHRAKTLLINETSKDFIDLLILKGDVEVAALETTAAIRPRDVAGIGSRHRALARGRGVARARDDHDRDEHQHLCDATRHHWECTDTRSRLINFESGDGWRFSSPLDAT